MKTFCKAEQLPDEWESLCGDNYSLRKNFLQILETASPYDQKYHAFYKDTGEIDTILITFYKRKHNLTMFSPIDWHVDVTFVYIPLSIARPGIVCGNETKAEVRDFIRNIKGFKVILNTPRDMTFQGFTQGKTCYDIVLDIRWKTFEEYMMSLRSNYRYRYNKALKRARQLTFYELQNNQEFDEKMYALYEKVYDNSRTKVEKLSIGFFRDSISKIVVCKKDQETVGFVQLIENRKELVFAFIGYDRALNCEYEIYINLLLKIVEYGIKHGFESIDLGQTADDTKLKLGGRYIELFALVHHSNRLINWVIFKTAEFKPIKEKFHVFKDDTEQCSKGGVEA